MGPKSGTGPDWSCSVYSCFFLSKHNISVYLSEAGLQMKTYIERGLSVPDHVVTGLVLPKLEQLSSHSWLLDGKTQPAFVTAQPCLHLSIWFVLNKHTLCLALLSLPCVSSICNLETCSAVVQRHGDSVSCLPIGQYGCLPKISQRETKSQAGPYVSTLLGFLQFHERGPWALPSLNESNERSIYTFITLWSCLAKKSEFKEK